MDSQSSRGVRRLADVATLRHLATVLEVSPDVFGLLSTGNGGVAGGPADSRLATVNACTSQDGDGEDLHPANLHTVAGSRAQVRPTARAGSQPNSGIA
jgi:hypothetical protein